MSEEYKFSLDSFSFSASSEGFRPEEQDSYGGQFAVKSIDSEFFGGVYGNLNILYNRHIHCFSILDKQWTGYSRVDEEEITVFPRYSSVVDYGKI